MNPIAKMKKNPWLIAGSIAALIIVWMLTGIAGEEPEVTEAPQVEDKTVDVRVRQQQAELVERFVDVYGRSEPARTVTLKAETGGRVTGIAADRGEYVQEGGNIVTLDVRDRAEQLERARSQVKAAEISHKAEQRLQASNLSAETRLAEAKAQLDTARAELKRIEVDLANTRITAPFDGALQERMVEVGDYVAIGDPVASFVDIDTLIVSGSVSETERANLEVGSTAQAELTTGQTVEGTVRYIDPVADEATRTFRIELEVPNEDHALPAGVTAQIHLPAGKQLAHRISPAILTLDADGEIGVKTVQDDDTVRFSKVDIVKTGNDGMWISGLPEKARIITVGQGFVTPGERVKPVPEDETDTALPDTEAKVVASRTPDKDSGENE